MTGQNQNPEQRARDLIDQKLAEADWVLQDKNELDRGAGQGIAIREYVTNIGPADYALFVDKNVVSVILA